MKLANTFSSLRLYAGCMLATLSMAVLPAAAAQAPACSGKPDAPVHESRFVRIGGIEQWIAIDGERCGNPVILFIHGGPGNPLSPFSAAIYGKWSKDYTLVQWDQRGAGRTYARNMTEAGKLLTIDQFSDSPEQMAGFLQRYPLTLDRMTEDGIEVAGYLRQHLGQAKLILMGSSWGSLLGLNMAKRQPGLFHAYIGNAQLVDGRANPAATFAATRALASAAGDTAALATMDAIGAPPWTSPKSSGALRRITRKYEAKASVAAPASWWKPADGYDTKQDEAAYEAGDDYSYVHFVGLKDDGMYSRLDLHQLGLKFDLPMYFIHGEADLVAIPSIARDYAASIQAPDKAFILLPLVGHDPNQAFVDAQFKLLQERVRPRIR